MALDSYTNLKLALANWTGRSDLDSSGTADDGIDLFESWVNRELRVRSMLVKVTSPTLASGAITHPSDWLQWKTLKNATSPYRIEIIADESLADILEQNYTGNPRYAVPGATQTELYPVPTSITGLVAHYYGAITALSGSNATNWLLTKFPDAYLYGTLLAMNSWARDDAQTQKYGNAFDAVMRQIESESDDATFGGSTLQIRNAR